jgi:hypothetical protein
MMRRFILNRLIIRRIISQVISISEMIETFLRVVDFSYLFILLGGSVIM